MNYSELINQEEYEKIVLNEDLILSELNKVHLGHLIKSYFYLSKHQKIIKLIDLIKTNEIEVTSLFHSYVIFYYLYTNDYLSAYQYIKTTSNSFKMYLEIGGANYFNLLKETTEDQVFIILCIFLETNKEVIIKNVVNNDYATIGLLYFEIISMLCELGYCSDCLNELTSNGSIIYKF